MSCMSQCVRKRMASSAFSVDEEGQKKKKTEKNVEPVEPRGRIGHTVSCNGVNFEMFFGVFNSPKKRMKTIQLD